MYHYTRPSFNTQLPGESYDGFMAGNFRHVLDPDDPRLGTRTAKERTKTAVQPKTDKADMRLTTAAPPKGQGKKKKKRK